MEQSPKKDGRLSQQKLLHGEPSKTYKAITVLSAGIFVAAFSCCCCVLPVYKTVEQIIFTKKADAKDALHEQNKDVHKK